MPRCGFCLKNHTTGLHMPLAPCGHPWVHLTTSSPVVECYARQDQPAEVEVVILNDGGREAWISAELEGPLTTAGAVVSPPTVVECKVDESVTFRVRLPPGKLTETLDGVLQVKLDAQRHRNLENVREAHSALPRVNLRFLPRLPRLEVEPPRLEFRRGQGVLPLRVRNVGADDCNVVIDRSPAGTDPTVVVVKGGPSFPCRVQGRPHPLEVRVDWERLPADRPETPMKLVLRPDNPGAPPLTVEVVARGVDLNTVQVALGVDFGTSKTVVAYMSEASLEPEVLSVHGYELTPTVVALERTNLEGRREWGWMAENLSRDTGRYAILRSMKTNLSSERRYRIRRADGQVVEFSPAEIATYFFREMLTRARADLASQLPIPEEQLEFGAVMLTHPAVWSTPQSQATRDLFVEAGLAAQRLDLRNEAASAALSGQELHPDQPDLNLLVYDMGAGTLDVTIVKKHRDPRGDKYEEEAAWGKRGLAGDWIDWKVAQELLKLLNAQYQKEWNYKELEDASLETEEYALAEEIKRAARDLKELLSDQDPVVKDYPVRLPGGVDVLLSTQVNRAQFEGWVSDRLRQETTEVLDTVFDRAQTVRSREEIDLVLLVGGSSLIPLVQRLVTDYFYGARAKVRMHPRPEFAVALGAAWFARRQTVAIGPRIDGSEGPQLSDESLTHSVGLVNIGNYFLPLARAGWRRGKTYQEVREVVNVYPGARATFHMVEYTGDVPPEQQAELTVDNDDDWVRLDQDKVTIPPGFHGVCKALIEVGSDENGLLQIRVKLVTMDGRREGPTVTLTRPSV